MDAWIRSLMEHGDARALICLGDEYLANDLPAEAQELYLEAAGVGDPVAALRLADLSTSGGERAVARDWLARAAEAGSVTAGYRLARIAESEAARERAAYWYRWAAEAGHPGAVAALARVSSDGLPVPDDPPADGLTPRGLRDVGTVVTTVVVTLVLAEFVKTLVSKLAEDTYLGVRSWLLRQVRDRAQEPEAVPALPDDAAEPVGEAAGGLLLVLDDPDRSLELNLWLDAPPQALGALNPQLLRDLERPRRRWRRSRDSRRRLYWDQRQREWRWFEGE